MKKLLISVAASAAILASAAHASATVYSDPLGYDYSTEPGVQLFSSSGAAGNGSLGFEFEVGATNLTINALGVFDGGSASNIPTALTVDVWLESACCTSGAVLASVTVGGASGGTQVGDYLFNNIAAGPLTLTSGDRYDVVAVGYSGTNDVVSDPLGDISGEILNSDIVQPDDVEGVYDTNPLSEADETYAGANFDTASVSVSEPASLAILGTSLLGLGGFNFLRHRKRNVVVRRQKVAHA